MCSGNRIMSAGSFLRNRIQKFPLWLLFVALALTAMLRPCILAAEQNANADKNSTQPNLWTQISGPVPTGVKGEVRLDKYAGPLKYAPAGTEPFSGNFKWEGKASASVDVCPFTAACFDGNLGGPCDLIFGDTGTVWSYQDPAKNCPPLGCSEVYPFEVNAIHVLLSNCDPIQSCLMVLTPGIYLADFTDPACPKPGNVICSGPAVQIILPPNTFCQEVVIPLDDSCCVDTTYFASLTFNFPNGPCGGICHDMTCDLCCDYGFAVGFLDFCELGLPGNLAIWTDGLLSCQSVCVPPPPCPQAPFCLLQTAKEVSIWGENPKPALFSKGKYPELVDLSKAAAPMSPAQTDFCLANNTSGNIGTYCSFPGGVLYHYQDPALTCPAPAYPFRVGFVAESLAVCSSAEPCTLLAQAEIYEVDLTDPLCPKPGQLLCEGPAGQVILSGTNVFCCEEIRLPIDCCVKGPYYAAIRYLSVPCNLGVCADSGCTPCYSYFDVGGGLVELCAVGACGDWIIWSGGLNGAQSNCEPADTLPNHYKTWSIVPLPFQATVQVEDQFIANDMVRLDSIFYLSNPVRKVVFKPAQNDTFDIVDPDDHLTWYRAIGRNLQRDVEFVNQFQQDTVRLDSLNYLLVPTTKSPHPPWDSVDHYKAYRIRKPEPLRVPVELRDQFDDPLLPELIDSLVPRFLLTPAKKNNEPTYDTSTHYLAYEIFPKRTSGQTRQTEDQFGLHIMQIRNSEFLLVPTRKLGFCPCDMGDLNCDAILTSADVVLHLNRTFLGIGMYPPCVPDLNCDGILTSADVVILLNMTYLGTLPPC